ncbi:transmembrane protein, putative [Medicago truncatula]|uniref:Transmembrane protein, putative n=1 Tax=Medicago truncatula TaxID=3880 RepID=A0A072U804_MEDTR|nr:transmembrane protein, putative [Medicago truncatula]
MRSSYAPFDANDTLLKLLIQRQRLVVRSEPSSTKLSLLVVLVLGANNGLHIAVSLWSIIRNNSQSLDFSLRHHKFECGDENGETIIDERKIRIKPLPIKFVSRSPDAAVDIPVSDISLVRKNSSNLDSFLDPAFMSLIPDQRRLEQWEKTVAARGEAK